MSNTFSTPDELSVNASSVDGRSVAVVAEPMPLPALLGVNGRGESVDVRLLLLHVLQPARKRVTASRGRKA